MEKKNNPHFIQLEAYWKDLFHIKRNWCLHFKKWLWREKSINYTVQTTKRKYIFTILKRVVLSTSDGPIFPLQSNYCISVSMECTCQVWHTGLITERMSKTMNLYSRRALNYNRCYLKLCRSFPLCLRKFVRKGKILCHNFFCKTKEGKKLLFLFSPLVNIQRCPQNSCLIYYYFSGQFYILFIFILTVVYLTKHYISQWEMNTNIIIKYYTAVTCRCLS